MKCFPEFIDLILILNFFPVLKIPSSVPEPKTGKTRIHLDIQVDDIDAGRRHVESLGGQWSGVRHDYDEGVVLVMHDPEGHEFCIVEYYVS